VDPHLEDLLAVAPGMRPKLREMVLRYVALFAQFDAAYAAAKAAGPGTEAGYHAAMDAEVIGDEFDRVKAQMDDMLRRIRAAGELASFDPVAQAVTTPKPVDSR
jgi:hypothetical protein